MSLSLPITFSALADVFEDKKIASRLMTDIEAWLNFETMKKSWYGDENHVLSITCYLLTTEKFNAFKQKLDTSSTVIAQQEDFIIYSKTPLAKRTDSGELSKPPTLTALFVEPTIEGQAHARNVIEQILRQKLLTMLNLIAEHQSLDKLDLND